MVTLRDEGLVANLLPWLHENQVEAEVRRRLGDRVAVSAGNDQVFLYAQTRDAAREAQRVVVDVLKEREMEGELALERWHPEAERWESASHGAEAGARQPAADEPDWAPWEVRVELASHRDAVELADRLEAEGQPVVRRWTFVLVGAGNRDDAAALAQRLEAEAPRTARVHVEPGGGAAWQVPEGNPFALFGGLGL